MACRQAVQREHGCGQRAGDRAWVQLGSGSNQPRHRPARSCWRSSAGAVTSSALSALLVWVRARMAVERATRSERIISTWPVPALGRTVASPACTARAAACASRGRTCRSGVAPAGRAG
jgi:hypothetical protein